ncbi:nucleolar 6, partial [Chlorella sorokiniana]
GDTMPAMHMLRLVLMMLANPKTFSRGLFMLRRSLGKAAGGAASGVGAALPPTPRTWRKSFEVVFVDSTGWLNLAASLSKAALAQARTAAAHSIQMLNLGTPEDFDAVFATRQRLAATCDYWFHVRPPPAVPSVDETGRVLPLRGYGSGNEELLQDVPAWRAIESRVESLAKKALGNRARLVRVFRRTLPRSPAGGGGKPMKEGALVPEQEHILLGVQVDATAALRTLDMGPPADRAKEAAAFRAFWGDKAELRRFQDGAIAETVTWEDEEAGGVGTRHHIVDSIVSYILLRHLPAGTRVTGQAGALDVALQRRHSSLDADVRAARLCEAAAERLSKRLRSLASDSLPLRVVAVQPLAPVLRHAAAFSPLPHLLAGAPRDALASEHVARCLEPVELLCQLEGSGKWPDELEPYQKMKAALGCQLAQQLHTALGLDAYATEDYVDVLTDGFAFRLLLATERDAAMQQMALELAGASRLAVEEDMPMRTWHQGAISGVAGESPAFEPSVRLAKRWVGAHLLSPHLRDEAPLIVDPSRQVGDGERQVILRQHAVRRQQGGVPPLCIITSRDASGGAWTADQPSSQMLHRIVVLAQRSAAALEALLLGRNPRPAGSAAPPPPAVQPASPAREDTPPLLSLDEIMDAPLKTYSPPPRPLARGQAEVRVEVAEAAAAAAERAVQAAAEAADAARAMLFSRDLGEYDALIQLRSEALPNGANELRLPASADADSSSSSLRPPLGPALQAANEQLAALSAAAVAAGKAKGCRAILRGIPADVLAARGHHLVRRQLLVGFDPLPLYTHLLQRRLGDLAVVCADWVGGRQVALKWRSPALAPAPLRPEAAHLCCPTGTPEAAPAEELTAQRRGTAAVAAQQQQHGGEDEGLSAAAVVPDLVAVLADAMQLCEGLVEAAYLQ